MKDDEIRDALFDADEWRPQNVDAQALQTFKAINTESAEAQGLDGKTVLGWIGRYGGRLHRVEGVSLGGGTDTTDDAVFDIPAVEGFLIPRSALEI